MKTANDIPIIKEVTQAKNIEISILLHGIRPVKPETQKKFDEKHHLGFRLLSNPNHKTAEAYGVWGEKKCTVRPLWASYVHLFSLMKTETSKMPGTRLALKIRFRTDEGTILI